MRSTTRICVYFFLRGFFGFPVNGFGTGGGGKGADSGFVSLSEFFWEVATEK
jgi:hypothetical protein